METTPSVETEAQYEAPRITDHGTLAELTAGPFSGHLDSIVGADGGWTYGGPGS
jgi:hypothetical protein